MANRLLIIVDPQIDFINGSLPVPKAQEAMDALAEYIKDNGSEYTATVITLDWHPHSHKSFIPNGGEWPIHCVAFSTGASIYDSILKNANIFCKNLTVLAKGTLADKEEYSIFQNAISSEILNDIIKSQDIQEIDICGLAGDICVKNTAQDAISLYGEDRVKVLEEFSPTIS